MMVACDRQQLEESRGHWVEMIQVRKVRQVRWEVTSEDGRYLGPGVAGVYGRG